ncbi:DlpA domain-containing protein [Massariosphaeria phaeospora]|uniref:DlpA domain-containing protein n=1 Tax=Massariosphaeria phaeospora TaxID=100035 RepID=A0A7C8MCU1_9PLEO|nr:DlpA domain-containing protein [Massariosphaeria phaeospora]
MTSVEPPEWEQLSRYSACDIADALLKLNVPGAGFLTDIQPIPHTASISKPTLAKTLAPASTFLMVPKITPSFPSAFPVPENTPSSSRNVTAPFADYAKKHTIAIISQPAGQACAVVGGIMAARMKYLGAKGVVVDGRVRDLVAMGELQLPIWSKGTSIIGAGAQTAFHAWDVPIRIGEVHVEPGDIVLIDPFENGVVSIPQGKVAEVLQLLPKLVAADEKVMEDVEEGISVKESFKRHRN